MSLLSRGIITYILNLYIRGKDGSISTPALVDQVAHYITVEHGSMAIHHSLFLISIGGNDVFFTPEVHAQQTAEKVELVVQRLKDSGKHYPNQSAHGLITCL